MRIGRPWCRPDRREASFALDADTEAATVLRNVADFIARWHVDLLLLLLLLFLKHIDARD